MAKISHLLDKYFENLEAQGKSKKTIENHRVSLKDFGSHFGDFDAGRLNKSHLKSYIGLLNSKPVKNQNQYVFGKLKILRYFIVFCENNRLQIALKSHDVLKEESALGKSVLKDQMNYTGPYLNPDEVSRIVGYWDYAKVETPLLSLRNKAIISLLYLEAFLPSDLITLRREDFSGSTIKVESQIISISHQSRSLLSSYLAKRTDDTDELFVGYWSFDPEEMRTHPITISTIRYITKTAAHDTGFTETISPQILRNSAMIEELLKTTYNYEKFTKKFRLSDFNTSYTRFLPKVKELLNIPKEAVTAEEYAKEHNLSIEKLLALIKSNDIPAIKFHHFYLVEPLSEVDNNKVKKRRYSRQT